MTDAEAIPLVGSSRRTQAYHAIRQLVVTGELAPGSSFTEGQLAARLGSSTVPVREALLLLAGHHLVSARHGAGYKVAEVTAVTARDAYRLRALLEGEAVKLATSLDPVRAGQHLRKIKSSDVHEQERVFHQHIAQHSGNLPLSRSLEMALLETERTARFVDVTPSLADHKAILSAIQAGDSATAKRLVVQHARSSESAILRRL